MKKLRFFRNNGIYQYGYIDKNENRKQFLRVEFMIFKKGNRWMLAITGHCHYFRKLSIAKNVGILIYNG